MSFTVTRRAVATISQRSVRPARFISMSATTRSRDGLSGAESHRDRRRHSSLAAGLVAARDCPRQWYGARRERKKTGGGTEDHRPVMADGGPVTLSWNDLGPVE
jgi:hypothetical protein